MNRFAKFLPIIGLAATLAGCGNEQEKTAARGHDVFVRVCESCHGANVGPKLNGVIGRKVASVPGFAYSDAMKKDANQVWTEDRIKNYLQGPLLMYPEGRMAITPLKPDEAADVVAYLKGL